MDQGQEPRASRLRARGAHRLEQTHRFKTTVTKGPGGPKHSICANTLQPAAAGGQARPDYWHIAYGRGRAFFAAITSGTRIARSQDAPTVALRGDTASSRFHHGFSVAIAAEGGSRLRKLDRPDGFCERCEVACRLRWRHGCSVLRRF